ncbi:MAG: DUF6702 family protein [Bacteroidia bacterium]
MHPYYVSVSEVRIDIAAKSVNVSCKLFTDDLQDALYRIYKTPIDLSKQNDNQTKMLESYIKERFKLTIGGKAIPLLFIGYEIEEEAVWCFLEFNKIESFGKVIIANNLLYDFLPEQTNLIHCYYNSQRKSYKLNNPDKIAVFEY